MADYFISYNKVDLTVATAIAHALKDVGISVRFAPWEVGLGDDIALWMTEALDDSERLIAIVSPDYLKPGAPFSAIERASMLWSDIDAQRAAVIPVKVVECDLPRILATRSFYDLTTGSVSDLVAQLQARPELVASRPSVQVTKPKGPYLNVPRGRQVIGRETDLKDLHQTLAENPHAQLTNSAAILAGQGGIGKSTLARAYAETFHADYDGTLWVLASTRQNVIDGLMALCGPLKLQVPNPAQEPHAHEVLAKLQETGQRWLIIYDNVETYDDFKGLEPPNAHLIATTRQGTGWPGFQVRQTDKLPYDTNDAPAVQLLMDSADRHDAPKDARLLAEKLDGLPLALVMAGRLIARAHGKTSFADYLADITPIIEREPRNEDYPSSVIGAVRLSYNDLSDDAKLTADLFAWWAPEGLESRLISGAPQGQWWDHEACKDDISDPVRALAESDTRVQAAMAELEDRSLLIHGENRFAMHRMTAAALRAMQSSRNAEEFGKAAAALLTSMYPREDIVESRNWPVCRRLTPHVRALWDSGLAPATAGMEALLNQSAIYLDKIADHPGMLEVARASMKLKEARLPEEHRDIAVGYATLGVALYRAADFPAALAAIERATKLDEKHRPDTTFLAQYYDLQGAVLLQMARNGDAAALPRAAKRRQQALALRRRLVGRQSDEVAESLNNLGAVRDLQGRTAAAARLCGASLSIRRTVLPSGDARLGYSLVNTGVIWLKAGRADLAMSLLEEALVLWSRVYAEQPQHPETKQAASWLIACLLTQTRAGDDPDEKEAKARRLCDEFGFDIEERKQHALQYPTTPTDPAA